MFSDEIFEETLYLLDGVWIGDGTGGDLDVKCAVAEALVRLPEEVRDFAISQCVFLPTGITSHFMPLKQIERQVANRREWLVIFTTVGVSDGNTPEDVASIVVHEIAHLWLGHKGYGSGTEEIDAAEQVKTWGFEGPGTRPSWLPGGRQS